MRTLLPALLLLGSLGGCAKEPLPEASMGLGLGAAESGCLDRAGTSFRRYLDGAATEAETAEIWDCAIRSLDLFVERARGQSAGSYTPGELRAFLQTYFLTTARVSDGFLQEAMELKRVLVGGSAESLTVADIRRGQDLLRVFREQSLQLRPHLPLDQKAIESRPREEVEAAAAAIAEFGRAVGSALEGTGAPYSFAHLGALLRELEIFQAGAGVEGAERTARAIALFRSKLPMLRAIKAALVAPGEGGIGGSEWGITLQAGASWLGLELRFENLAATKQPWSFGETREAMLGLARQALALVDQALMRHSRRQIPFEEVDRLIAASFPQGVEVKGHGTISIEHAQRFVRPLVRRWLGGEDPGFTGRAATGIMRSHLRRAWGTLDHWAQGQRYIEALFEAAGEASSVGKIPSLGFSASELEPFTVDRMLSLGKLRESRGRGLPAASEEGILASRMEDAAARIRDSIAGDRPLFAEDDGRIRFTGYRSEQRRSIYDLSEINWMYEGARLLMRGYAEDPERAATSDDRTSKVNFGEFKAFVEDIRDIGVDLHYLDPKDPNLAEKRFREASLFTFAGDGDEYVSAREGGQLLGMMVSAKRLADQIHEEIRKSGCATGPMDPFNYPTIDAKCYRSAYFRNFEHFWDRMPALAAYFRRLNGVDRDAFARSLEEGARKLGYTEEMMNSSDSEGFAMLPHYLEVIFSRFDKDESGTIDLREADDAFPVFRQELEKLTCLSNHCMRKEDDLKAVFTYLLGKGEVPSGIDFLPWRYLTFTRSVSADRSTLAKIFARIANPPPAE